MSDTNRIGCSCWYRLDGKARAGTLRIWSHYSDEDGGWPVAVVEDMQTLSVTTVAVELVSFAAIPPWPRGEATL